MGDGADMALDRGFNDEEEFYNLRGATQQEYFEAGFLDESGVINYPRSYGSAHAAWTATGTEARVYAPECAKPSGPGPCPLCGTETVKRLNRKLNIKFYGCPEFPKCKGNRNGDE